MHYRLSAKVKFWLPRRFTHDYAKRILLNVLLFFTRKNNDYGKIA